MNQNDIEKVHGLKRKDTKRDPINCGIGSLELNISTVT